MCDVIFSLQGTLPHLLHREHRLHVSCPQRRMDPDPVSEKGEWPPLLVKGLITGDQLQGYYRELL